MKEFDEIDDLFNSAFNNAEATPPPMVKQGVDAALFSTPKGGYMWIYGILVFALVCGGIVAYQMTDQLPTKLSAGLLDEELNEVVDMNSTLNTSESIVASKKNNSELERIGLNQGGGALDESVNTQKSLNSGVVVNQKGNSAKESRILVTTGVASSKDNRLTQNDLSIEKVESISGAINHSSINTLTNNLEAEENNTSSELAMNTTNNELNSDLGISSSDNKSSINDITSESLESNTIEQGTEHLALSKSVEEQQGVNGINNGLELDKSSSNEVVADLKSEEPEALNVLPVEERDTLESQLPVINNIKSASVNPWTIAVYAGGQGGINSNKSTGTQLYFIKESLGLDVGLDVNYQLNAKFGVGVGIDYFRRNASLRSSLTTVDSISNGGSWVINNPNLPDSLQDSTFVETFSPIENVTELENITRQTSIGIPVYVAYTMPIAQRFKLRVAAGARFSYESFKVIQENGSLPVNQFSSFGVNAMIRPELTYGFNKAEIGVYGKVNYDLKHALTWDAISRRRYGLGAGVVFRYKF
ncbi:MAG: outer membrane beta-barrel protein [Crocinitomicaceae bacterium]